MKNAIRSSLLSFAQIGSFLVITAACFAGCGGNAADDSDYPSGDNADSSDRDGGSDHRGSAESHCAGTPDLCSVQVPPGCGSVSGCRMYSRLRWNGTWDDYCDGVPDPCSFSVTSQSCKNQGCKWE
jgi:hypothetical protein